MIEAVALFAAIGEAMPSDTIYVDETVTHSPLVRQYLPQTKPQSFMRGSGGLGQGLGLGARRQARGAGTAGGR